MDDIIELIKRVRKFKLENNIKEISLSHNSDILTQNQRLLDKMLKLTSIQGKEDTTNLDFEGTTVTIYYDGTQNKAQELEKLYQEKERLELSIARREKLLANQNYISKAPKQIVENEKEQLTKEQRRLKAIITSLND